VYVERLQLADFRSYAAVDVNLAPGPVIFQGSNGQGKTNLVEAVEYLSTLGSHRVSTDQPLIRAGCQQAVARAQVVAGVDDPRKLLLEIEIRLGKSNRARLNRGELPRPSELVGVLRTVLFSPEDLAIVKGEPADRRRFLDSLVVGRWPRMAGVKADYDGVLKQRNALLKSMSGRSLTPADPDAEFTLQVWDEQLAGLGAELMAARLDSLAELMPLAAESYRQIAPVNNVASAQYQGSIPLPGESSQAALQQALADAIVQRRREEIARGVSLVGPHRDELLLSIGELPARGYASHGESWSLALALRLASCELLRADGIEPVLILDDVFAELDAIRRERLAGFVQAAEQVLVTAAVPADVPAELRGQAFQVTTGQVTAVEKADANAGGERQ